MNFTQRLEDFSQRTIRNSDLKIKNVQICTFYRFIFSSVLQISGLDFFLLQLQISL